ncbi:MAG TPA: HDIG domain-containing protein [Pyrinomonadaceae bacterium]|nr:HDIG domain-containing protein [Pyrinomonadaceae bacterium]
MSEKRRRQRFNSPLDRARNAVLGFLTRPFTRFRPRTRFFIFYGLFVVVTTLLLVNANSRVSVENYHEGDVVRRTVIAPADISVPDLAETEKRREAAREATRPVFSFDSTRAETAAQSFRTAWEDLQKQAAQTGGGNANARKELRWTGAGGGGAIVDAITAHHFDAGELERLTNILREISPRYIYEDGDAAHLKHDILLEDMRNPSMRWTLTAPQSNMTPLSEVQKSLRSRISQLSGWTTEQQEALFAAMSPLIKPTVMYYPAASQAAREEAAGKVETASIQIKRNQVIAREGDTVNGPMLAQMQAVRDYARQGRRWWNQLFGLLFLVGALYWLTWKFIEHRSTAVTLSLSPRKAFALVGSAVVVQTILARVGFTLAESVATRGMSAPLNDPVIWDFAVPFASATLLVALLVDTKLGMITALVTSLFAGLLAPTGILVTIYAVISSTAALYGIGRYRERQSVTVAGLLIAAVNALTAVAVIAYAQQPLTFKSVLFTMGCGVLGGLLTTIFTAGGLPINESAFGILTDVKLLELSNADLPVLGQLALRAPGTNQHSHAVGQLAEDACRAVGANPLLARIGALYHDIGKTAAPDYFVENQTGENPHDRLKPTQSAKIITSHVTYGLKLAKEIGLPKQISDFIPQHHGTRTLHFFLRKAQAQAAPGEEVDEADFRYPGPKPQFKESAIMMIADSCEAAARSLAQPNPENIRTIVTKIVDAIISDGQLDECNLSLKELTNIREAIITSLTAIYHARIDYPGFNPPPLTSGLAQLPRPELDTEERGVSYNRTSEIPINKAGEVEDEAIPRGAAKR